MGNKKKPSLQKNNVSFLNNNRFQLISIIVVTLLLYSKIISFQFIGLDEPTLIIDNYEFLKDFSNFQKVFSQHVFYAKHHTDNSADYYRPILTLSFMLDTQFSAELSPRFYHFSNIIYHIISIILLFYFFKHLKINSLTTFFLCLIFALHPILTQAIAWIPGRNDSLIAIFTLLSFNYFIKYCNNFSRKNLIIHVLFFAIALLTKESGMAIIAITFFYFIFIAKQKLFSSKTLYILVGYLIVIISWYFMRKQAFSNNPVSGLPIEIVKEVTTNFPLIFQYLQKIILPINLSVMSTPKDTNYLLSFISILLLALGLYFTKPIRWNYVLFGALWFLAFISPSLLTSYFGGLEHRAYLSVIGILIIVSEFQIFQPLAFNRFKYVQLLILASYTIITINRLPIFRNSLVYWESAVKTSDNSSLSCLNLGKEYERMGKYQKAIDVYREGLKRNPKEKLLHNNIGGAYILLNLYDKAEIELKKEIELAPESSFPYFNIGFIRKRQNKMEEAVSYWIKSLQNNKNFLNPYQELADYYKSIDDTLNLNYCLKEINRLK